MYSQCAQTRFFDPCVGFRFPSEDEDSPRDSRHLVVLLTVPLPTGEVIEPPFSDFGYRLLLRPAVDD